MVTNMAPRAAGTARSHHRPPLPTRRYALLAVVWVSVSVFAFLTSATVVAHLPAELSPGWVFSVLGDVAATVGALGVMLLIVLASRIPLLETQWGQPQLVHAHRRLAPWVVTLIVLHVAFTTFGWGLETGNGFFPQLFSLVTQTGWMMPALLGFCLFVGLSFASHATVRKLMRYDVWWVSHLYLYLAVLLSFGHQLTVGTLLTTNRVAWWLWVILFAGVFALVAAFRWVPFLLPAKGTVCDVREETPGTFSLYVNMPATKIGGVKPGQYYMVTVRRRGWWWRSHPYSASATVVGSSSETGTVRFTIAVRGEQTQFLRHIPLGACVGLEGPYGTFTDNPPLSLFASSASSGSKSGRVVFFLSGIGVTPALPVLAALGERGNPPPTAVVWRTRTVEDSPLGEELACHAKRYGYHVNHLVGGREQHPVESLQPFVRWGERFYVCGSESFTADVLRMLDVTGVPKTSIHHETF